MGATKFFDWNFSACYQVILIFGLCATCCESAIEINSITLNNSWVNDEEPGFEFIAADNASSNISCILYLDDVSSGLNESVKNNTLTVIKSNLTISQGMHVWYINCTDNESNTGQSNICIINIDNESPVVNLTTYNGSWTNEDKQGFLFNAMDNLASNMSCVLYVDGLVCGTNFSVRNNTFTSIKSNSSLGNGNHSWYVNCTDNASNTGQSENRIIKVDTQPPSLGAVGIYSVNDDGTYVGTPISIRASANDSVSSINGSTCEYTVNGTAWFLANWNGALCYKENITINNAQICSINFRVNDSANNQGTGAAINRTGDNSSPTLTWFTPSVNTYYKDGGSVVIDLSVYDGYSGLSNGTNCTIKIDGSTAVIQYQSVFYFALTGRCSGNLFISNSSGLSSGAHQITAEVADRVGNIGISTNRQVMIDNTAPSFNISVPEPSKWLGLSSFIISTDQIQDSFSGVNPGALCTVKYASLGINVSLGVISYDSLTKKCSGVISIPNFADSGQGTLTVSIYDLVGNSGSANQTVYFDKTPPLIYNIEPDGLISNTKPKIKFNSSDNGSGVENTTIILKVDSIVQNCTLTGNDTNYECSYIPTSDLGQGVHIITVEAKDKVGNLVQETSIFTVDTTPPFASCSISRISATNDSTNPINITCIASDSSYISFIYAIIQEPDGVNQMVIELNDNKSDCDTVANDSSFCGLWTPNSTTWEKDGFVFIDINISDKVNNTNIIDNALKITIDSSAPEIVNYSPSPPKNISGVLKLSANVTDGITGVKSVIFSLIGGEDIKSLCYGVKGNVSDNYLCYIDTTTVADGDYNITIEVRDYAENTRLIATGTIKVDNNPPLIVGIYPSVDITTSNSAPKFTVNVSDGNGVGALTCEFTQYINGSTQAIENIIISGNSCSWTSSSIAQGSTIYVKVRVEDGLSHWSSYKESGVYTILDTTPPVITNINPSVSMNVLGVLTIQALVTDNVEVKQVKFSLMKGPDERALCYGVRGSGNNYSCNIDTATINDDLYTVNVTAIDASGNIATGKGGTVRADNNPPAIISVSPNFDQIITDSTPVFSASVNDNGGVGAVSCEFKPYINGVPGSPVTVAVSGGLCSWKSGTIAQGGNIYVEVMAKDGMNHSSSYIKSGILTIKDTLAPVISSITPSSGVVSGILTLSAVVTDNVAVKQVRLSLTNGGNVAALCYGVSDAGNIYTCGIDTPTIIDGSYTVNVTAIDTSGNSNTDKGGNLIVDNNPPVISLSPNSDQLTTDSTPMFSASVDDKGGVGAASCEFIPYVDGISKSPVTVTVSGGLCLWESSTIAQGSNIYVEVMAKDGMNHSSNYVKSGILTIKDLGAPVISNINPSSGNISGVLIFSAVVVDNVAVKQVRFSLVKGGNDAASCYGIGGVGNVYTCSVDTATVYDGSYIASVTAVDNTDNSNLATEGPIMVDNNPPEIVSISPDVDQSIENSTGNFSAVVSDGDGVGAATCEFTPYINGSKQAIENVTVSGCLCFWTSSSIAQGGTIYVKLRVVDGMNHWSSYTESGKYTIEDTTAPVLSNVSPAQGNFSGMLVLSAVVTDNVMVKQVKFILINGNIETLLCYGSKMSGDTYSCSLDTSGICDGNYTVNVTAIDDYDNINSSSSGHVTMDNNAPLIVGLIPGVDTPAINKTPVFTANVSDGYGTGASFCEFIPYKNNIPQPGEKVSVSGDMCSWTSPELKEGDLIYVKVRVVDGMNHWSSYTESGKYVVEDITVPFIANFSPECPKDITGVLKLSADVTDNVGVMEVVFSLVKGTTSVSSCYGVKSGGTNTYSCSISSEIAADGNYTINVTALDTSLNSNSLTEENCRIDNNPPIITAIDPGIDEYTTNPNPGFIINISDGNGTGAVQCEISVYINRALIKTIFANVSNDSCSWHPESVNLTLSDGSKIYIGVRVKDATGKWNMIRTSGEYTVITSGPKVSNVHVTYPEGKISASDGEVVKISARAVSIGPAIKNNTLKADLYYVGYTYKLMDSGYSQTIESNNCSPDSNSTIKNITCSGKFTVNISNVLSVSIPDCISQNSECLIESIECDNRTYNLNTNLNCVIKTKILNVNNLTQTYNISGTVEKFYINSSPSMQSIQMHDDGIGCDEVPEDNIYCGIAEINTCEDNTPYNYCTRGDIIDDLDSNTAKQFATLNVTAVNDLGTIGYNDGVNLLIDNRGYSLTVDKLIPINLYAATDGKHYWTYKIDITIKDRKNANKVRLKLDAWKASFGNVEYKIPIDGEGAYVEWEKDNKTVRKYGSNAYINYNTVTQRPECDNSARCTYYVKKEYDESQEVFQINDSDSSKDGIQASLYLAMRIPEGTQAGVYSTNYALGVYNTTKEI